jgi:hypothetical protein
MLEKKIISIPSGVESNEFQMSIQQQQQQQPSLIPLSEVGYMDQIMP